MSLFKEKKVENLYIHVHASWRPTYIPVNLKTPHGIKFNLHL